MYGFEGVGLSGVQLSIFELSVVGGWVVGGWTWRDKRTSWWDLVGVRQKTYIWIQSHVIKIWQENSWQFFICHNQHFKIHLCALCWRVYPDSWFFLEVLISYRYDLSLLSSFSRLIWKTINLPKYECVGLPPPCAPHQTSMYHNQLKGTSRREENVNITSTHGDEMKKTIQGSE